MAIETERKFLVKNNSYRQTGRKVRITQGYISTDPGKVVRVRIYDDKAFLTFKSLNKGISRFEFEFEIDTVRAMEMLEKLCIQPFIDKFRYLVEYNGFTWEVDEFLGENEGLVVAEIELPAENTPFDLPAWVGAEVTQDPKYLNSNLVKHPFSTWGKK